MKTAISVAKARVNILETVTGFTTLKTANCEFAYTEIKVATAIRTEESIIKDKP